MNCAHRAPSETAAPARTRGVRSPLAFSHTCSTHFRLTVVERAGSRSGLCQTSAARESAAGRAPNPSAKRHAERSEPLGRVTLVLDRRASAAAPPAAHAAPAALAAALTGLLAIVVRRRRRRRWIAHDGARAAAGWRRPRRRLQRRRGGGGGGGRRGGRRGGRAEVGADCSHGGWQRGSIPRPLVLAALALPFSTLPSREEGSGARCLSGGRDPILGNRGPSDRGKDVPAEGVGGAIGDRRLVISVIKREGRTGKEWVALTDSSSAPSAPASGDVAAAAATGAAAAAAAALVTALDAAGEGAVVGVGEGDGDGDGDGEGEGGGTEGEDRGVVVSGAGVFTGGGVFTAPTAAPDGGGCGASSAPPAFPRPLPPRPLLPRPLAPSRAPSPSSLAGAVVGAVVGGGVDSAVDVAARGGAVAAVAAVAAAGGEAATGLVAAAGGEAAAAAGVAVDAAN